MAAVFNIVFVKCQRRRNVDAASGNNGCCAVRGVRATDLGIEEQTAEQPPPLQEQGNLGGFH